MGISAASQIILMREPLKETILDRKESDLSIFQKTGIIFSHDSSRINILNIRIRLYKIYTLCTNNIRKKVPLYKITSLLMLFRMRSLFFQCTFLTGILLTVTGCMEVSGQSAYQMPIDSLLQVCENIVDNKPATVLKIATQLLAESTRKHHALYIAQSHYYLGKSYRLLDSVDRSHAHLQAGLKLFRSLKNTYQECRSLKDIGNVYRDSHETDKAMMFYNQALTLVKKHHFTDEQILLHNNIAGIYEENNQYDKAIAIYKEGLTLGPSARTKARLLSNLGLAYGHKNNFEEGLKVIEESKKICADLKDSTCMIDALGALCSVYWFQEKDKEVILISTIMLGWLEKAGSTTDRIETHNRVGNSYTYLNQYALAVEHFKKALALAQKIRYPKMHYIYANIAQTYERAGQYKSAYEYFTIHKRMHDSITDVEKKMQIDHLLVKYETAQKEQKIKLLQKEKQLQHLKLQQQTDKLNRQAWIQRIILLVALLVLAFLSILWILYRQRMQSKLLLAAQTEQVNRQQTLELIREHELKTIRANLEGRDKERVRIARELHDGVAGTLAGLKLHLIKVASEQNQLPVLDRIITNMDSVYQEVRTISHNLNPPKVLDTAFIDLLRQQLAQQAEGAGLEVDFICHPEATLNQLPDTLKIEVYRILQELMTNTIKHAQAQSVEVQFTHHGNSINLLFEDSGKGFDMARVSPGVGLSNIGARVRALSGNQHIESTIGRGTIVNIDIPLVVGL